MNSLLGFGTPFISRLFQNTGGSTLMQSVRTKAKKASGTKRNKKSSKGQHYSLKFADGQYVKKMWVLATQPRLRYHGGLNVGMFNHFALVSLAEGRVVITSEKTDLNWEHSWNQKFYAGLEGAAIYKKYVNVVPLPQPQRFKFLRTLGQPSSKQ